MEVQITSSAEVKTAVDSPVGRVDALVTPQDNTLASAYDAVVKATRDAHLPLFSLDTTAVQRGALTAMASTSTRAAWPGRRWWPCRFCWARTPPPSCPSIRTYDLYLNAATASADGITFPEAVAKRARTTYEK